MARSTSREIVLEDALHSLEEGGRRLWRWILLSGFVHMAVIASLFMIPYFPASRAPAYPVYTVDLVGGEKIGGGEVLNPVAPAAAPETKETKKAKPESKPQVEEAKKKKVVEIPDKAREKVALKESKKEIKKEVKKDSPAEQGLSEKVRGRLIQSALERVRDRAEQKGKKAEGSSSGTGEGPPGAASLGEGDKGGGVVKGVEFIAYHNRMLSLIRERWAWVGKRSDLEVTVRFSIQENGEITNLRIVKRSADSSFDNSVFRAVSGSNPLPPPPENYRKDFADVELTFRPKDLAGG